jgi:sortase A
LEEIFQREIEREDAGEDPEPEEPVEEPGETPSTPPPPPAPRPTALGVVEIPKIKSRMPIYQGTSNAILNIGVGQIEGTTPIGEIGNTALAGHRSYTYGHQWNRLDEVERDDLITVTVGKAVYTYRVYKTHIVEPTDITVLYRSSKHKVLTLVTCHPIRPATHRLIVHALQIEP